MTFLIRFITCISLFLKVNGILEDRLKYVETFHHDTIKHHINKRDLYNELPHHRGLEFNAHGKHFKASLHRDMSLFSPDFRLVLIQNDKERVVDFEPGLYHGHLDNDINSAMTVYMNEDGTISGNIKSKLTNYIFEPSWRHIPESSNHTMIVYNEEDVNFSHDLGKNFCGHVNPKVNLNSSIFDDNHSSQFNNENSNTNHTNENRGKRSSSQCTNDNKMICPVMLVADYRFHRGMGNGDYQKTAGYLISQLDQINQIYNRQEFGSCGLGFEFEIREIRIHNEFSDSSDSKYLYNSNIELNTTMLLETFSRDRSFEAFCLAHLFTHTGFENGVLGLAYIGSPRSGALGGICSPSYFKDGWQMFLNTGWSSSLNRYNRKLLSAEASIVTAHEFGHNWGSEHDPDTNECSPRGGKYIMYTYSVAGRDENNKLFSPCSRRSIGAVLRNKAQSCFSKKTGAFCGNYKLEPGEECDEGPEDAASSLTVSCCNKCKLKHPTFQCSDTNHQCCDGCMFAPSFKPCSGEQDFGCKSASRCSGYDATCTPAENKENGTVCLDFGKCVNGKCLSICEYNNLLPCICDTITDSCKWCCKNRDLNAVCEPYRTRTFLPIGTPCMQGQCDAKGICVKQEMHNTIQRLWKIIENINANSLVMFMRANIVGTVIILSLIIWIPVSCLVSHLDNEQSQKLKDSEKNADSLKEEYGKSNNIKISRNYPLVK